jgi:HD-GYP domain-containing protein (c-di-GMP phosphodiesterase class II)
LPTDSRDNTATARVWGRMAARLRGRRSKPEPTDLTELTQPGERELERAQLRAYAQDLRNSYARELRRTQDLKDTYLATVKALAAAVEAKDEYTGGHIQRVHALGLLLAQVVIPQEAGEPQLSYGFLLHDIGKLAVPDAVLNKPGPLDEHEWQLLRQHPEQGARILAAVPFLDRALDVVRHHHERWDGGGYPDGLSGEDIPLWARIFAVVDTVDAVTSDRPYRAGRPLGAAIHELRKEAGTQFDPECVEAFLRVDRASIEALLQERGEADPLSDDATGPDLSATWQRS